VRRIVLEGNVAVWPEAPLPHGPFAEIRDALEESMVIYPLDRLSRAG
jgi:hypothetical protein